MKRILMSMLVKDDDLPDYYTNADIQCAFKSMVEDEGPPVLHLRVSVFDYGPDHATVG